MRHSIFDYVRCQGFTCEFGACNKVKQWAERASGRRADEVQTGHRTTKAGLEDRISIVHLDFLKKARRQESETGDIDVVSCAQKHMIRGSCATVIKLQHHAPTHFLSFRNALVDFECYGFQSVD